MTAIEDDSPAGVDVESEGPSRTAAHVVEFRLADERCAIDIDAVDSIVETKQITRVPRAPEAVEGVMDLRGETTAVVDPRTFLNVAGERDEENILVLDRADDKQKIGIRVNDVQEVSRYSQAQVDENGELAEIQSSAIEADLVRGVIRKHGGDVGPDETPADVELILWLDIDRLIDSVRDDEERTPDNQG